MKFASIAAVALIACTAPSVMGAQLRDVVDIGVPEETPLVSHTRMFRSLDEASSYDETVLLDGDFGSYVYAIGVAVPCAAAVVGAAGFVVYSRTRKTAD